MEKEKPAIQKRIDKVHKSLITIEALNGTFVLNEAIKEWKKN